MSASSSCIVSGRTMHTHSLSCPDPELLRFAASAEGQTRSTREWPTNPFVCAYLALAAGAEIKINMWHWLKLAVLFFQNLQLGLVARLLLLLAPCSECGFPALWHPLLHNFNLFSPLLGFLLNLPRRVAAIWLYFWSSSVWKKSLLKKARFPFPYFTSLSNYRLKQTGSCKNKHNLNTLLYICVYVCIVWH